MTSKFLVAVSALCCLPMNNSIAHEPRDGVKYDFNIASTGDIYFQPQVPDEPDEGEIWIDSKTGDRFFYYGGAWVSHDYRVSVTKPEPRETLKPQMMMRPEKTSNSKPMNLTSMGILKTLN